VEKTPINIFCTFGSKINMFERKKSEKKGKNSKNLKVAGNHPNIYFTQYLKKIHMENRNTIRAPL
jgi:hypothetical protein